MPRKSETREIDGVAFTCQQFSYKQAKALSARAWQMFTDLEVGKAPDIAKMAVRLLVMTRTDASIIDDLLSGTVAVIKGKNGEPMQLSLASEEAREMVFAGKLDTAFKAAVFAAEVNYLDFSSGVFGELKKSEGPEEKTSD